MQRTQKIFLTVTIIAILIAVVLISLEIYYIAIALLAGILIIGHRELWALIRRKKIPAIDERIRENSNKSIRNGFIFLLVTLALLMLPFSTGLLRDPSVSEILGALFVCGGIVYTLSYLYYDRAEPRLGKEWLRMLRIFLLIAGISIAMFVISVFMHNAFYALFEVEEPVFFVIGVIIAPLAFLVGLIGSLVIVFKGLFSRT